MQRIFDRYEYDETNVIGIGGMGTVYQGADTQANQQPVAVKYLKPEIVKHNPEIVSRFRREGEALSELNHPNIVKMLEAGQCDTDHYIVMEYVPGGSLRELLDAQGQLSIQRVLYIALDLADALTRAHRLNILHRDIKPGNVLLAEDGTPRLTDFGVARTRASDMTQDGQLVGTLAYISPEAITGGPVDQRHDIWAFGVVLFEMLAGHRPFQSEAPGKLINEITTQPLPDLEKIRPDVPVSLIDLVYRMLNRNVETRLRSVREVGAELERIIHSGGDDTPIGLLPSEAADRFRTTTTSQRVIDTSASTPAFSQRGGVGLVNVPVQATPFVGRVQEVQEVAALLRDDNVRLVTLVGPGGTGKTRIGIAVADEVKDNFPDGVYYVPLASLDQPDMVPVRIAEVLGFQFSGSDDPMEEMIAFMRDKTALMILDNMEHLVDGAEQLSQNMEKAPFIKILATSRERLRLRGENVYEVDSMIVPPGDVQTKQTLLDYPSAQLFVSSAQRAAPDFAPTDDNTPHVAQVIALVQGMPLGIELAAGWLEMLPLEDIVEEIETSLDFLETDLRDMPERHRSIRAVFDYSWNLMTDQEREAFMALSVFRGGFDRNAARKVTDTSLRVLTALVNKSLLSRQPDGRYLVPKLTRQYGTEAFQQLDPAIIEGIYTHYVDYYTVLVEKLKVQFGTRRDLQALEAVDKEIENIRHALLLATEYLMEEHLRRLTLPMNQYYLSRSLLVEAVRTYTAITDALAADNRDDTYVYWQVRVLLATALGRQGDYKKAEQIAQAALHAVRKLEKPFAVAYTLNGLAYAQMMLGRYDEARTNTQEAIGLTRDMETDEYFVQAIAAGNLGYLEFLAGNLQEAKSIYEKLAQNQYDKSKSPIGYGFVRNNLGEIVQAMGDYDRARDLYQDAYDTFKELRHKRGLAFSANNLAGCYAIAGDYEKAEELYQKAYRLNKETGDRAGLGHSLSAMANIATYKQNWQEAYHFFRQALEIREQIGDRVGYGRNLTEVGMSLYMLGRVDEGRPYYEAAQQVAEELDNDTLRANSLVGAGAYALVDADAATAMQTFRQAVELVSGDGTYDTFDLYFVLVSLSFVMSDQNMPHKATQILGFLETQVDDMLGAERPALDNLRHALHTELGAGFDTAYQQGSTLSLADVQTQVLAAPQGSGV